jgi:hypothetical protein
MSDAHEITEWADPAVFYQALGRVLAAIRHCHALCGAHHLDWWAGLGGRTWEIEWQEGPYPAEVAEALLTDAARAEGDGGWELRAVVRPGKTVDNPHYAYLEVCDVPVTLRALNPVGIDALVARLMPTPAAAGGTGQPGAPSGMLIPGRVSATTPHAVAGPGV